MFFCGKKTNRPPDYFSRKPRLEEKFIKAFNDVRTSKQDVVWLYKDEEIEEKITASANGEINEGYVLGYPKCCVRWEEEISCEAAEAVFQDIKDYLSKSSENPEIQDYKNLFNKVFEDKFRGKRDLQIARTVDEHIRETIKSYPFVPHWACSSCLNGESGETGKMNDKYKQLAKRLYPPLARKIIYYSKKKVKDWDIEAIYNNITPGMQ